MELLHNYFVGVNTLTSPKREIVSEYLNDNTNGYGKLFIVTPDMTLNYNGQIKDGKMNGHGLITYIINKMNPTYKSYDGFLVDNNFDGSGIITYTNGDIFIGEFKNNKKHGAGKMYNSNGDLIMDNIWKNDIVCGKVEFIEYYHNTRKPKIIGNLNNSIRIGQWKTIREDFTIEKIDFYNDDVETLEEKYISVINTHPSGHIICQKINCSKQLSNDDLIIGNYESCTDKLIHKINSCLDKDGFDFSKLLHISIPLDKSSLSDHTLLLYINANGIKTHIKEIINGKEYDRIIFLDTTNKYVVNTLTVDHNKNVSVKKTIYIIDDHIPILYYEGELDSSYKPTGIGSIYSDGKLNYTGTFEWGNIISGMQFTHNENGSYMSYDGTFKNNVPNGEGIIYNQNGIKIYEGHVVNGIRHGNGISYWENTGEKYWEGEWHNDMKHGKGKLYDETGILICSCIHEYDQMIGMVE